MNGCSSLSPQHLMSPQHLKTYQTVLSRSKETVSSQPYIRQFLFIKIHPPNFTQNPNTTNKLIENQHF